MNIDWSKVETVEHKKAKQKAADLAQWKADRDAAVSKLLIEYNGAMFQGDEVSQGRMARAITTIALAGGTIGWLDANNVVHDLTADDLQVILGAAVVAQAALWTADRP